MSSTIEVKICGLTNLDDVLGALDAGADYLGFVMYDRSPRGITASETARILERLDVPVKAVGVFVNETRANMEKIASDCGLHAVQVHGDERAADFAEMPVMLWRSVRLDAPGVDTALDEWGAERLVVDASVPGMYGGTGVAADWVAAAQLAAKRPVMLAGGLTTGNVAESVRMVKPLGVDTASGVEREPGKKDLEKVREFVRKAKGEGGSRG